MTTLTATVPSASTPREDAFVIGLVSIAHGISHYSQLLLPALFPWLKDALGVSYAELGFLLTIFFTVSCAVQTLSGFVVDHFGPRPVLLGALGLIGLAIVGFASSTSYWMMAGFVVLAGIGNGPFHPVDYTLLNRKVAKARLGHAYSAHGVSGNLGWALAPAMMVPLTMAYSWRVALLCAAALTFAVLALLWFQRERLSCELASAHAAADAANDKAGSAFGFLAIPAVWMCFAFFFFYAAALSVVQSFSVESARILHSVPLQWAAICLSVYMVCSACGMVVGGFLAADASRCERIIAIGLLVASSIALTIGFAPLPAWAVPVLFGAMGLSSGIAGPSRDLIVKRSTPENASGRVFGVVYSGLDIGQAVAPLLFGPMMDAHRYTGIWVGLAVTQMVLIASAFNVQRVRRTASVPQAA